MNIPKTITQGFLDEQIQKTEFKIDNTDDQKWCLCILTVANGFKVTGVSHRQFSVKHVPLKAKSSAYEKATEKLWQYYTFLAHVVHCSDLINLGKGQNGNV